jgi:glutamyl-tRNA synthetase
MIEDLRRLGALYACSCSRVEFQRSTGQGVHACSCRDRGLDFDAPGVAWRLRLIEGDLVRIPGLFGREGVVDLFARMGDPVVRQRDGMPAYQVASLADDVDFGITFIVRGEDLLPSTACQLVIAGLLQLGSFANVRFVHHPLITDHIGRKLSKSEGAFSLKAMREAGSGPDALWHEADSLLERLLIGAEEGR